MAIKEKIEEIRRKPDHIKLRYVWACVIISMILIFFIWIFSINFLFQGDNNPSKSYNSNLDSLKQQLNDIKQPTSNTLKEGIAPQSQGNSSEGITNNQQLNNSSTPEARDFQYPVSQNGNSASINSQNLPGLPATSNSPQQ